MIKDYLINKIRSFQANAGSAFKQEQAEAIWKENLWKMALGLDEISELRDAWAKFVVNGDRSNLDESCNKVITRIKDA